MDWAGLHLTSWLCLVAVSDPTSQGEWRGCFLCSNQDRDNSSLPVKDHCKYYLQILLLVGIAAALSADLMLTALEERIN